jgi:hypothetical protein
MKDGPFKGIGTIHQRGYIVLQGICGLFKSGLMIRSGFGIGICFRNIV